MAEGTLDPCTATVDPESGEQCGTNTRLGLLGKVRVDTPNGPMWHYFKTAICSDHMDTVLNQSKFDPVIVPPDEPITEENSGSI